MDRRGRYEFFAEQYEAYLPRVLNYVRLRVSDEPLAQDLTAEAFERALANIDTLRDPGAFGGWLFRIARNVVAGYYRAHPAQVPLEMVEGRAARDPVDGELALVEGDPASAESEVVHAEELAALRRTLCTLPEREQEIVRLRFVAGLSHRAIGKAMGLRAGNVAVILYRALRKLRARLEREDQ
ncbi:MAG: sigma-70 family RNA polymerase sigma factor [Anaerolineae bacterium]|nr:sigma-70 family RNA polymerase sigma factor [Anaerolineae bacterium]